MKIIKGRSSKFINESELTEQLFRWQPGYGAFSVSVDRVPIVTRYIQNQKDHHARETMLSEYERLLQQQGITDAEEYMFHQLL